jgi:riboflavin biosynthesis pyrimidine reductase
MAAAFARIRGQARTRTLDGMPDAPRPAHPPASTIAIQELWSAAAPVGEDRGEPMPDTLRAAYGGPLRIPLRPDRGTILMNFVSTLDGIVALGPGEQAGGAVISGHNEADRFVMALLRAIADVVLMGAGTIAGGSSHQWTAGHLHPSSAPAFREWRATLGLAEQPTVVIVTGSGEIHLGRRGLDDASVPVVFATTAAGSRRLADQDLPSHARIEVAGSGERLSAAEIATVLERVGGRVVLSEGGPHLYGNLAAGDLIDELFLTVAPQIVGRGGGRLGLVEGVELPPDDARWQELASIKRDGDHLFLRYRRRA